MCSNEQLSTWAKQGATISAKNTHSSIRTIIDHGFNGHPQAKYTTYLQGSYINSTNIYSDGDVDVVIEFSNVFLPNTDGLNEAEKTAYERDKIPPSISYEELYNTTFNILKEALPSSKIERHSKCIKISPNSGRVPCDVVIALNYKKYSKYPGLPSAGSYIEGIAIQSQTTQEWICNFPKMHKTNGAMKNVLCSTNYKSTIRIFKNARNHLKSKFNMNIKAPSYFIECMLYNVPHEFYHTSDLKERVSKICFYLHETSPENFICQNKQLKLFGPKDDQWNTKDFYHFNNQLMQLFAGNLDA